MNIHFSLFACSILLVCFSSCKKESNIPAGNNGNGTQLIRIQQGTNPATDTVFEITYSGADISSIYDSIYSGYTGFPDTLYAVYQNSILQSAFDVNGSVTASYKYGSTGLLTEIDANVYGENDKYQYTYTGNTVLQKTWYTDFGEGGASVLYKTFNYTVAGGNITEAKTYNSTNALVADVTFTYGSQPHAAAFKQLALLDIGDYLGFNDFEGFNIGGCDTYFNAGIMTGYTNGTTIVKFPDILNANQLPVLITDTDQANYIFTWQFSYK